jgi:hypothetical protein
VRLASFGGASDKRFPLGLRKHTVADPIFYIRVEFAPQAPLISSTSMGTAARYIAHLYLQVEDSTYASAWASDFCTDNGHVFVEFLSHPVVMEELLVREYEPEHQTAFALAQEKGHATVISIVLAPPPAQVSA